MNHRQRRGHVYTAQRYQGALVGGELFQPPNQIKVLAKRPARKSAAELVHRC